MISRRSEGSGDDNAVDSDSCIMQHVRHKSFRRQGREVRACWSTRFALEVMENEQRARLRLSIVVQAARQKAEKLRTQVREVAIKSCKGEVPA